MCVCGCVDVCVDVWMCVWMCVCSDRVVGAALVLLVRKQFVLGHLLEHLHDPLVLGNRHLQLPPRTRQITNRLKIKLRVTHVSVSEASIQGARARSEAPHPVGASHLKLQGPGMRWPRPTSVRGSRLGAHMPQSRAQEGMGRVSLPFPHLRAHLTPRARRPPRAKGRNNNMKEY